MTKVNLLFGAVTGGYEGMMSVQIEGFGASCGNYSCQEKLLIFYGECAVSVYRQLQHLCVKE